MTAARKLATCVAIVIAILAIWAWASREPRVAELIRNTLMLGLGAAAIAVPAGALLALVLFRTDAPGRVLVGSLLAAMLFVPLYLQAAAWDAGFGRQGWFSLTRDSLATPVLAGWRAAIWIHGIAATAWVMLIVGVALRYVEPELEDAALLEATPGGVFRRVTLRRALPAIGVSVVWVMLGVVGEMTVTDLYQVRTFAEETYLAIQFGEQLIDSQVGVTAGAAFLITFAGVALWAVYYLAPTGDLPTVGRQRTFCWGRWRWVALLGLAAALLCILALPLLNLLINAGMRVERAEGGLTRYWSPAKCARLVASSPLRFSDELGWTLLVGALTATVAVSLAAPLAWMARHTRWWSAVSLVSSAVCLTIPGPVIGLAVIGLLNRESFPLLIWLYDRTIAPPVLALVVRAFPLSLLVSWYALSSVSTDQLDAAATEGAGIWTRFGRVAGAQRIWAFTVVWLTAFAVAAGDLSASILVTPPGITTVPIRVFGLLHAGVDDQVAGLCLTVVLISALLAASTIGLVRWQTLRESRVASPESRA